MGFILKAIGIAAAAIGINKIRNNIEEEKRRKNSVCHFDGNIKKEEFYVMVKRGGKGIKRLTNLYVEGPIVHGTVRSQSGLSDWCFTIDFNDYGDISGRYWLATDNTDSDIPKIIAERIAEQIRKYPECADENFVDEIKEERKLEELREQESAYCPYCGEKVFGINIKFCSYCGKRFRV